MAKKTTKRITMPRAKKAEEKAIKLAKDGTHRGGTRIGAGRPPASIAKRLAGIREITMDIIKSGKVPLRVMINNMVFYDEKAVHLEEMLADALADNSKRFSEEGFLKAMELFAKLGDTRMMAQKCACDSAPFLHPRLSAVDMQITKRDAPRDLKDDEQTETYREDFRKLRSAPFIIEQTDVEIEHEPAEDDDA